MNLKFRCNYLGIRTILQSRRVKYVNIPRENKIEPRFNFPSENFQISIATHEILSFYWKDTLKYGVKSTLVRKFSRSSVFFQTQTRIRTYFGNRAFCKSGFELWPSLSESLWCVYSLLKLRKLLKMHSFKTAL